MGGTHSVKRQRWVEAGGRGPEEGLQPRRIRAAAKQEGKRKALRDSKEAIGINRLAETAGDQPEDGFVPMVVVLIDKGPDEGGAVIEAPDKQVVTEGRPYLTGRSRSG
jgi:hypothetical protein